MVGGEDEESCENSTEESAEQLSEIEARLYSIVHYNDLSKPLDESLTSQYDIEVTNDQQIIVTLKAKTADQESDKTSGPVTGGEEGASEAKIQKVSGENVANVSSNLETSLSEVANSQATNETTSGVTMKENAGVVVVTIEDSESKCGDVDGNHQTKPDKTISNEQRIIHPSKVTVTGQRITNASTVTSSTNSFTSSPSVCFGSLVSAFMKGNSSKKKKKKKKRKKGNEIFVDLTSDNDDSDCQVIGDLSTTGVVENGDDSLVLNVLDEDEIIDDHQNHRVESGENNVDGKEKDGAENASESVKKVKLTKKQRKTKIKMKRKSYHCPKKWTTAMVKYYCKTSKRLANFDHVPLIRQMKASNIGRDKWALSHLDRQPPANPLAKKRCDRCRQFGHVARFCQEPVKPLLCHMCGLTGHRESRCPDRKCLNCGTPNEIFVEMCSDCHLNISNGTFYCEICDSRMHRKEFCPNVWRAFHMTTRDGPLLVPYTDTSRLQYCSNCAGTGHLFHECRGRTFHVTPYALCAEPPVVPDYSRVAEHYARVKGRAQVNVALQLRPQQYEALSNNAGCQFLQALSDRENVTLRMQDDSLAIEGLQSAYYPVCSALSHFLSERNL